MEASSRDRDLVALEGLSGTSRQEALGAVFERHRDRLRRMIDLRLGSDIRSRLDASDVLQETWVEASSRLDEYLGAPKMPLFLWLRFLVRQRLITIRRAHIGVQRRDPRREVPLPGDGIEASAELLAAQLMGHLTTPTRAARREEQALHVQSALAELDPLDREILSLRHFEQLSNVEAACELGIATSAASKRYVRAIRKLKARLESLGDAL